MGNSCVPVFPPRSVNSFAIQRFHPVPIDLGEMRKLCEVEKSCSTADLEGVYETRCVPVFIGRTADPDPSASTALRMPSSTGLVEEDPPIRRNRLLTQPNWEVLSPSVVIRRRPKRMQGLSDASTAFPNFESDVVAHLQKSL